MLAVYRACRSDDAEVRGEVLLLGYQTVLVEGARDLREKFTGMNSEANVIEYRNTNSTYTVSKASNFCLNKPYTYPPLWFWRLFISCSYRTLRMLLF